MILQNPIVTGNDTTQTVSHDDDATGLTNLNDTVMLAPAIIKLKKKPVVPVVAPVSKTPNMLLLLGIVGALIYYFSTKK